MNRYISVNRIEFVVSYICNSKCKHCQLGEEEEKKKSPNRIDTDLAVQIVNKLGKRYGPDSVMTFGGEPLLHPNVTCAIHGAASAVGIPSREIITNGFWSTDAKAIQQISENLAMSGVNEVLISVDCFHQEFIPLEYVRMSATSLMAAGIVRVSWNPCWVIDASHENPYNQRTRAILEALKDLPVMVSEGNVVQPEGRTLLWLRDYLPERTKISKGSCGDIPYTGRLDSVETICVEPDGRIAVCKEFYIGSANETDVTNIVENYDPFNIPEARALIENGIEGLRDWVAEQGVEPDPRGYHNTCQMCKDLRRRAGCASI